LPYCNTHIIKDLGSYGNDESSRSCFGFHEDAQGFEILKEYWMPWSFGFFHVGCGDCGILGYRVPFQEI
jgi:hypothetical protein